MNNPATATAVVTRETFKAFLRRFLAGDVKIAEFQEMFAAVRASEASIKAELSKLSVKEMTKNPSGRKKAEIVNDVFNQNYRGFFHLQDAPSVTWEMSFTRNTDTIWNAYAKTVAGTTQEHIDSALQRRKDAKAERERLLTNPTTFEDFRRLTEAGMELTAEQRVTWERLQVEHALEVSGANLVRKAEITQANLEGKTFSIVKGFHTKHQKDIWVVTLSAHVGPDAFKDLAQKARMVGGNWARGWGTNPAGFQFFDEEKAKAFAGLESAPGSRLESLQQTQATVTAAAAERLADTAERMSERAQAELERDRKTNTWKRASAASQAEAQARKNLALAETMQNVADAIKAGTVRFLRGITAANRVTFLEETLGRAKWKRPRHSDMASSEEVQHRQPEEADVEFAEYPWPQASAQHVLTLAAEVSTKPGGVLRSKRFTKLVQSKLRSAKEGAHLVFDSHYEVEQLRGIFERSSAGRYDALRFNLEYYDMARRCGFEDEAFMRTALREYLPLRGAAVKADPLKLKERALVGCDIPGFFPTPKTLIARMLELAEIQPGMHVLEPSAGKGDIADELAAAGAVVDCIECHYSLREILTLKGFTLVGSDFMDPALDERRETYDLVCLNPPFENGQDWRHTMRAYEMLKPGGRLVGIVAAGIMQGGYGNAVVFQTWLGSLGAHSEQNPEGSFATSEAFRTTSVSTYTLVINKPR